MYDGEEAAEWLRFNDYDVLILDVMLPNKNGIDLCRHYRHNKGSGRVLLVTSRNSIRDKEYGFESGADDYITKPFDLREIAARVRALMRRSLVVSGETIEIGNLLIDTSNHTVTRSGEPIDLQPQEFALLEFLARHSNRIFSADKLIKMVWKGNSSTNTVRTHIKTLRKKIDNNGEEKLIKTIHGVGYTLTNMTMEENNS